MYAGLHTYSKPVGLPVSEPVGCWVAELQWVPTVVLWTVDSAHRYNQCPQMTNWALPSDAFEKEEHNYLLFIIDWSKPDGSCHRFFKLLQIIYYLQVQDI